MRQQSLIDQLCTDYGVSRTEIGAHFAIAISLKRIADAFEKQDAKLYNAIYAGFRDAKK